MARNVNLAESFSTASTERWQKAEGAATWGHQLVAIGGSATVIVEGSYDTSSPGSTQTIVTLTAADGTPDGAPGLVHTFPFIRARCTALGGTRAQWLASGV